MRNSDIKLSDIFTGAEIQTLGDSFNVRPGQIEIEKHPYSTEKLLLHVDYEIPGVAAASACTYLNAFFFEPLDSPRDRLVFEPNFKAWVGAKPGHTNLYITFSDSDKSRLLAFLASHQDELDYVHSNIHVADAFRPNVTFARARAVVESGLYPT